MNRKCTTVVFFLEVAILVGWVLVNRPEALSTLLVAVAFQILVAACLVGICLIIPQVVAASKWRRLGQTMVVGGVILLLTVNWMVAVEALFKSGGPCLPPLYLFDGQCQLGSP